jgi:uncharacterized membrane protein
MNNITNGFNWASDHFAPLGLILIISYWASAVLSKRIVGHPKSRTTKGIFITVTYCLAASFILALLTKYSGAADVNTFHVFSVVAIISLAVAFFMYRNVERGK